MVSYVERKRMPKGSLFVGFQRVQARFMSRKTGEERLINASALHRPVPVSFLYFRVYGNLCVTCTFMKRGEGGQVYGGCPGRKLVRPVFDP